MHRRTVAILAGLFTVLLAFAERSTGQVTRGQQVVIQGTTYEIASFEVTTFDTTGDWYEVLMPLAIEEIEIAPGFSQTSMTGGLLAIPRQFSSAAFCLGEINHEINGFSAAVQTTFPLVSLTHSYTMAVDGTESAQNFLSTTDAGSGAAILLDDATCVQIGFAGNFNFAWEDAAERGVHSMGDHMPSAEALKRYEDRIWELLRYVSVRRVR